MILDERWRYSPWHVSQAQFSAGLGQLLKVLMNRKEGLACNYIFRIYIFRNQNDSGEMTQF